MGTRRHADLLRRRHPRLAGHVPEVPRGRGVLRRRRARLRRRPDGQGARPDRAHERRVPRIFPGPRRGVRRRRARAFTDALEQPGFYWKVFERDEYEAVEGDPMAKHGLFHELASERLAGGSSAPKTGCGDRRPPLPDRRERRRAVRAGDARAARRRSRGRERGTPRRAGRRAHDDHGRAVDVHAVGHAAGGERGGDRAGDRGGRGLRCPTSGGASSTSTARRRTPRSTRA